MSKTTLATNEPKALSTQRNLKSMLSGDAMRQQFAAALPRHLSPERFVRVAITALTRTPLLQSCTPESFFKCLLDLSAMGLEPDGRRAHLIPFKNNKSGTVECTLIVDYKGLVELVRRDPSVLDVQCHTIRENDAISVTNGEVHHSYNPLNDRGEVRAVYTRIAWKGGHVSCGEPMTWAEVEPIRDRSSAWQGWLKYKKACPWNTDAVEMWKKTAIRRDSKMWPLSPEIRDAVERDDHDQFGMRNVTASVVPPETDPLMEGLEPKVEDLVLTDEPLSLDERLKAKAIELGVPLNTYLSEAAAALKVDEKHLKDMTDEEKEAALAV